MEYDYYIIFNNFCIGYYCIFGMGKCKIEGLIEFNKIFRLLLFGFMLFKVVSLLNLDYVYFMFEIFCSFFIKCGKFLELWKINRFWLRYDFI